MATMLDILKDAERSGFMSTTWSIPGFQVSDVRPDWMHLCCLGILQYLLGNVLWELVRELGGTISNPRNTLNQLEQLMHVMSRELHVPTPFHSLTIGMIRTKASAAPKLKLKAAEGRHLLPIVRFMLLHAFSMESEHAQLRFNCVDALNSCHEGMKDWQEGGVSSLRLAGFARKHVIL